MHHFRSCLQTSIPLLRSTSLSCLTPHDMVAASDLKSLVVVSVVVSSVSSTQLHPPWISYWYGSSPSLGLGCNRMTLLPEPKELVDEFGRMVLGLRRGYGSLTTTDPLSDWVRKETADIVRGVAYMPELLCAWRDGAVRSVCGEWGDAPLLLLKLLESEDEDGWCASCCVRCRGSEREELLLLPEMDMLEFDCVGARLRVSEYRLCARRSSITSGSSSVIPFKMSANVDMVAWNCASVRQAVEKRACSY